MDVAQRIAKAIELDLSDRSGLGNEWDQIDNEIKRQIRETWVNIIRKELSKEGE